MSGNAERVAKDYKTRAKELRGSLVRTYGYPQLIDNTFEHWVIWFSLYWKDEITFEELCKSIRIQDMVELREKFGSFIKPEDLENR